MLKLNLLFLSLFVLKQNDTYLNIILCVKYVILNTIEFYSFADFSLVFRTLLGWHINPEEILTHTRAKYIVWMVKDQQDLYHTARQERLLIVHKSNLTVNS